jgi:hypothetical protein
MHYISNLFEKLRVSDKTTAHHQEYLNIVYTQQVFVMLALMAPASEVRVLTTLADANRTRKTNTYCLNAVLRYS